MVASEFNTPAATIRIHDDWMEPVTDSRASQLSRIVSASYRRRVQDGPGGAVAAFGPSRGKTEVC